MKQMTFGENVKRAREQQKLTQETLAKNIKKKYNVRISTSYLSMIETNSRTNLTVKLINALLQHLELPREAAYSLFTHSPHPVKYDGASDVNVMTREAQKEYSAQKTSRFSGALPPEAQKPLDEIYNLLVAKYVEK